MRCYSKTEVCLNHRSVSDDGALPGICPRHYSLLYYSSFMRFHTWKLHIHMRVLPIDPEDCVVQDEGTSSCKKTKSSAVSSKDVVICGELCGQVCGPGKVGLQRSRRMSCGLPTGLLRCVPRTGCSRVPSGHLNEHLRQASRPSLHVVAKPVELIPDNS